MKNNKIVLTSPSNVEKASKSAKAALEDSKTFAFDELYWSFNKFDSR